MKDSIIRKMKGKGLKLTPQRLAIVEALVKISPLHPTASLIYQEAGKKFRGLSLSTVYAALSELSKRGIIKMLEFDRMENRFEGNIEAHINLVCKGCNKIIDYPLPIFIDPKEVVKKASFLITDTRLEYYGYCQDCIKK